MDAAPRRWAPTGPGRRACAAASLVTVLLLAAGAAGPVRPGARRGHGPPATGSRRGDAGRRRRRRRSLRLHALARPFAWMARPDAGRGAVAAAIAADPGRVALAITRWSCSSPASCCWRCIGTLLSCTSTPSLSRGLKFPMDLAVAVWLCGPCFFLPNVWLGGRISQRQLEHRAVAARRHGPAGHLRGGRPGSGRRPVPGGRGDAARLPAAGRRAAAHLPGDPGGRPPAGGLPPAGRADRRRGPAPALGGA